jgi:hypothetical protein
MVKVPLEHLVQDADLIIVGTVELVKSSKNHGKIFSLATVSVGTKVFGQLKPGEDKIVIRFPGGTVGDIGMKAENGPEYNRGEHVLLFLQKIPNHTYYRTLGSSQGKFLVQDNIVVSENLSLDHFLERIENIIGSGK